MLQYPARQLCAKEENIAHADAVSASVKAASLWGLKRSKTGLHVIRAVLDPQALAQLSAEAVCSERAHPAGFWVKRKNFTSLNGRSTERAVF
ncbi:hypothetical protein NA643_16790 [Pseudomonas stutzeri]|uniref:hypothetical protein n=1 Tax=Stutzerimonas stutzeri TaxID=316 RepID=UPI0011AF2D2B|nr:hypothetical protein [Stutzerimonas stutzeri]MCQ4280752.1 hypothetical protein [Stutzerimonas stutzeri]